MKEGLFVSPPVPEPHVNKMIVASKSLAQFSEATSNSADGNYSVVAFVACLANARSPANVGNLISFSVVNAFKRPTYFSFSNIGVKVFKVEPPVTYCDAPSTIIGVTSSASGETPSFHGFPNVVNSFSCETVNGSIDCRYFPAKTPTGFCCPCPEAVICDDYLCSTVAKAQALSTSATRFFSLRQNYKPCKSFTDYVYSSRHCIGFLFALFSGRRWFKSASATIMT